MKRELAIIEYYKNPNYCKNCYKLIKIPDNGIIAYIKKQKFCSHSCVVIFYNKQNSLKPKIKLKPKIEYYCIKCNKFCDKLYGSGKFCSRRCSNSRIRTKETKEKISKTLIEYNENLSPEKIEKRSKISKKLCKSCDIRFKPKHNYILYCSRECYNKSKYAVESGIKSASLLKKRSKNEILFAQLCSEKFNILCNKPMFGGWDADIIILDYKISILWNGVWHYKKITQKHSLLQVQTRDKIKIEQIKNCNYTPYIIKDMGKFNPDFVHNEFNKFLMYLTTV